jgi:hypothetical protein
MRWFRIRRVAIPQPERDIFERFGVPVIGMALASGLHPAAPELHAVYVDPAVRSHAADWLTEQYDRTERKETWSITMEAAITILVATELYFSFMARR